MLDYIFYRVHKAYLRWDGKEGSTSFMILAGTIMLYTIVLVGIALDLCGAIKIIPRLYAQIFIIVYFLILYKIIHTHYRNRYDEFAKKWMHEDKRQKIIRGILVVLFAALPFAILFIYVGCTGTFLGVNFLGKY